MGQEGRHSFRGTCTQGTSSETGGAIIVIVIRFTVFSNVSFISHPRLTHVSLISHSYLLFALSLISREGYGEYCWADGTVYKGSWIKDKMTGKYLG